MVHICDYRILFNHQCAVCQCHALTPFNDLWLQLGAIFRIFISP